MTPESGYLRSLARAVMTAVDERVSVQAAVLTGSAARGNADRFSDLDLLVYVTTIPASELLEEVMIAAGGVKPVRRDAPTDHFSALEFTVNGVRTELTFFTVTSVEDLLDRLLGDLEDVNSALGKVLLGIDEALPLHGEALIARWKARLRPFPEPFRRAMITAHWEFFPLWYHQDAIAARESELWRLEVLLDGAFNLLGVLAGLNRLYYARFELKRTRTLTDRMQLAPPALADRIEALFTIPPGEAAIAFGALIEETRALIHRELPDLALELPKPLSSRQRPWTMPDLPSASGTNEDAVPAGVGSTEPRIATRRDFDHIVSSLDMFWGDREVSHLHHPTAIEEFGDSAFVIEDPQGRVAAYLFGMIIHEKRLAYVNVIAVRSDQRGRGHARRLYGAFSQLALPRGCRELKAITTPTNSDSIAFHRSIGMEAYEVRDYSGPGQDRIAFSRRLT